MRRFMALFALASAVLLAREYGPPAGTKLPGFTLPDQDGKTRSLDALLGKKGAVVVFYRSADW